MDYKSLQSFEWEWPPWTHVFERSLLVDYLGRIGRCGLVGGGVSLGMGLEVSKAHLRLSASVPLLTT